MAFLHVNLRAKFPEITSIVRPMVARRVLVQMTVSCADGVPFAPLTIAVQCHPRDEEADQPAVLVRIDNTEMMALIQPNLRRLNVALRVRGGLVKIWPRGIAGSAPGHTIVLDPVVTTRAHAVILAG